MAAAGNKQTPSSRQSPHHDIHENDVHGVFLHDVHRLLPIPRDEDGHGDVLAQNRLRAFQQRAQPASGISEGGRLVRSSAAGRR